MYGDNHEGVLLEWSVIIATAWETRAICRLYSFTPGAIAISWKYSNLLVVCLFFVNYFSKIIVWWLAIIGTIEFFHGVVIFCQLAFKRAGQSVDWISSHWVCMWICSNPLGWCGLLCPKMNGSNKWLCTALRFRMLRNRHAPTFMVGTKIISMALTLVGLDIGMLGHCYGLDICTAQTLVWLWHGYALTLVC